MKPLRRFIAAIKRLFRFRGRPRKLSGRGGYLEVNGQRFKIISWDIKPGDIEPNDSGFLATKIRGFGDFEIEIQYDPPKNFREYIDGMEVST